jgi:hypothetical protein
MTEMEPKIPPSTSLLGRLWEQVPKVIRAIAVGFIVFEIVASLALFALAARKSLTARQES